MIDSCSGRYQDYWYLSLKCIISINYWSLTRSVSRCLSIPSVEADQQCQNKTINRWFFHRTNCNNDGNDDEERKNLDHVDEKYDKTKGAARFRLGNVWPPMSPSVKNQQNKRLSLSSKSSTQSYWTRCASTFPALYAPPSSCQCKNKSARSSHHYHPHHVCHFLESWSSSPSSLLIITPSWFLIHQVEKQQACFPIKTPVCVKKKKMHCIRIPTTTCKKVNALIMIKVSMVNTMILKFSELRWLSNYHNIILLMRTATKGSCATLLDSSNTTSAGPGCQVEV